MTELENVIICKMLDSGLVKFHGRYVDDMLVLAKSKHFDTSLGQLNSFHSNPCFMVDKFEDGNVHFLDISLDRTSTDIYRKDTNTRQYVSFSSFKPWPRKIAWARAQTCSTVLLVFAKLTRFLQKQISMTITFLSWNGFPKSVASNLIRCFKCIGLEPKTSNPNNNN